MRPYRPRRPPRGKVGASAILHGQDMLSLGFAVDEVVHNYGDLCQAITDLAVERDAPFSVEEFRTLNLCLDNAIAYAVTAFSSEHDLIESPPTMPRRINAWASLSMISATCLARPRLIDSQNGRSRDVPLSKRAREHLKHPPMVDGVSLYLASLLHGSMQIVENCVRPPASMA